MKSWKLSNNNQIIQLHNGRINCYCIVADRGNILIDNGKRSHCTTLLKNFEHIDHENKGIYAHIITHSHYDHCSNTAVILNKYNCKLYIGKPEAKYAQEGYTPLPQGTNLLFKSIVALGNSMSRKPFEYDPFSADVLIDKSISLQPEGFDIDIIPTPGHNAGSISIVVNKEIALVGDAMFGVFPNSINPPFADDTEAIYKSWVELYKTNAHTFLPGHGKPISRQLVEHELNKKGLFI